MFDTTLSPQRAWTARRNSVDLCLYRVIADIGDLIRMSKNKSIKLYLEQVLEDLNTINKNHIRAKDEITNQIRNL